MALRITKECINCGACAPECPVEAISEADEIYRIDRSKCTECAGEEGEPRCVAVCPVECIVRRKARPPAAEPQPAPKADDSAGARTELTEVLARSAREVETLERELEDARHRCVEAEAAVAARGGADRSGAFRGDAAAAQARADATRRDAELAERALAEAQGRRAALEARAAEAATDGPEARAKAALLEARARTLRQVGRVLLGLLFVLAAAAGFGLWGLLRKLPEAFALERRIHLRGDGAPAPLAWSPGGQQLATRTVDGRLLYWSVGDWVEHEVSLRHRGRLEPRRLRPTQVPAPLLAWAPNGARLAVVTRRVSAEAPAGQHPFALEVWSQARWELEEEWAITTAAEQPAALLWRQRDEHPLLAVGWRLQDPRERVVMMLPGPAGSLAPGPGPELAYLPRGGGELRLITRPSSEQGTFMQGGTLADPAWSPDRSLLVTARELDGKEASATVWRPTAESRAPFRELRHPRPVHALAWSSNGHWLAVGSGDLAYLWRRLGSGWDSTFELRALLSSDDDPAPGPRTVEAIAWTSGRIALSAGGVRPVISIFTLQYEPTEEQLAARRRDRVQLLAAGGTAAPVLVALLIVWRRRRKLADELRRSPAGPRASG